MASKKTDRSQKSDEDEGPIKIDKWDGAAVKNALDDAAKKVILDKYGYDESFSLIDGRLFICTISVGFAAFALVWDYLHPFPESRPILILCVVSYFLMMGVLTLYTTMTERGSFLLALEKDKAGIDPPNECRLASQLKRYDDQYSLYMTFCDGQSKESRTASITKSVADFIDEEGYVCSDLFQPEIIKLYTSLGKDKKSN